MTNTTYTPEQLSAILPYPQYSLSRMLGFTPEAHACPYCKAVPGQACKGKGSKYDRTLAPHKRRIALVAGQSVSEQLHAYFNTMSMRDYCQHTPIEGLLDILAALIYLEDHKA